MEMKFIIQRPPIPQERHRTFSSKGKSWQFDPLAKKKEETRLLLARQLLLFTGDNKTDEEALLLRYKDFYHVSLVFVFKVCKTDSKATKKAKLEGLQKHTKTPDLDNLEKFILDCMTGVLFSDDKKVVKLQSEKKWGTEAYTEVSIEGFNFTKENHV
jgi:Holliday junction resolvase RusA-like endonuclease